MSDRGYTRAFTHIVKFPDGVDPPNGYKPAKPYDDYIGVVGFDKPSRRAESRIDDGFTGLLQAVPIVIRVEEPVLGKIMPLLNKPIKADWEVELKVLAKEEKGEASVAWESELEGVRFEQIGPDAVMVFYQEYKTKKYFPKGPTVTEGYNFPDQEDLG